jgi:diacylglycerol kinase family enzyme
VEVSAEADQPRQVDGELIEPSRSLTVAARPGALKVLVPT